MNKISLSILSGAIGLAIGSIGTYILLKKKYEETYYDELHKAIDEECEILRTKHSNIVKEHTDKEVKIFNRPDTDVSEDPENIGINDYQKRLLDLGEIFLEGIQDGIDSCRPHFIDEDEFRFLPEKYEIRELQFLRQDGTVLDVNDEIVADPEIYISGLRDKLEMMHDGEAAYILVESIGVAIEIVILDGSYQNIFGEELDE